MVWEEFKRNGAKAIIGQYEASTGAYPPGYIYVSRCPSQRDNHEEVDVIKITKLDLQERNLVCEYEILSSDISLNMAITLISKVVLGEFYDNDFDNKADNVEFIQVKSNSIDV